MMLRSCLIAFALLGAWTSGATAQSGTQAEQNACSRDASRFCRKQMADGDSAVQQCLRENRAKLGASCNKVFESHGL